MSVNKYNRDTGTIQTLASGTRIWIGSRAAHSAAIAAGTLPSNCLIAITDDSSDKTTKFPDYARGSIYTVATNSYTMPEDGYVTYTRTSGTDDGIGLRIDGEYVSGNDISGGTFIASYSGYARKGSVITTSNNTNMSLRQLKVFGLI